MTICSHSVLFELLISADTSVDIGSVGFAGSVVKTGDGGFTMTGSGSGKHKTRISHLISPTNHATHDSSFFPCTDIWYRSDQFHYDYYIASGDVTIEMLVDSFVTEHIAGKGGLMIRETLAPNSKHFSGESVAPMHQLQ